MRVSLWPDAITTVRELRLKGHTFTEIEEISGHTIGQFRRHILDVIPGEPTPELVAQRLADHREFLRTGAPRRRIGKFTKRQMEIAVAALGGTK